MRTQGASPPRLAAVRPRASLAPALLSVLALAFAVRLLPAAVRYVIGTDEALYLTLAQHLAAGDGYTADGVHPHSEFDPGYPLFGALVYRLVDLPRRLTGSAESAVWWLELPARLNLVLFGGLLAAPVYALAHTLVGDDPRRRGLAWRAGLLTALLPALVLGDRNFEAASEQLYSLALWTGWLLLWLGLEKRRPAFLLFSGVAFGLAHLTRWEGLVSAGVAGLFACLPAAPTGADQSPGLQRPPGAAPASSAGRFSLSARPAVRAVLVLAGALLLAAPYAAYQTTRTGSIFSTKAIVHQLHGEALASSDPFAWEKAYSQYERVRDNPGQYPPLPVYLWQHAGATALNYGRNFAQQLRLLFTSPTFLTPLWLPLAVLGARRLSRRQNLFLAATCFPALIFPLSVVDQRYLLPLLPAALLWSGAGLIALDKWAGTLVQRLRSAHRAPGFLAAAVLCAGLLLLDGAAVWLIAAPVEYRALGVWMRASGLTSNDTVLARKRQVPFYAGARWEWLPFGDTQTLLDYAAERNSRYAVIDERTVVSLRPDLVYLLDSAQAPPSLQLRINLGTRPAILLYQVAASP